MVQQLATPPPSRIVGFDLARAYAIFGMFIVNFHGVFGDWYDGTTAGRITALFAGNSSTLFVVLAGIGCSQLTWRPEADAMERRRLRRLVAKRAWFLFASGLALYTWWSPDILHFYGGYMHLAALLLFASGRALLVAGAACVVLFHVLLAIVPYDAGWNLETSEYLDFWTVGGFLRNTLYNGWNSILPWAAFFFLGMWLGRCDWSTRGFRLGLATSSAAVLATTLFLNLMARNGNLPESVWEYFASDYLPPYLPFIASTASFALLVIHACVVLGERHPNHALVRILAATGQCSLTLYVGHVTLGMLALGAMLGRPFRELTLEDEPTSALRLLGFSVLAFATCALLCAAWRERFRRGPLEWLMRRVCG